MSGDRDDLLSLSDFAFERLSRRMAGLDDAEYFWQPVPDCRTVRRQPDGSFRSDGPARPGEPDGFSTLAWRLCHIIGFLQEGRNGPWLGRPARSLPGWAEYTGAAATAAEALAALPAAYQIWREHLAGVDDASLAEPLGKIAAPYFHRATRRAFVLHILDELIHHGAEAALLRDLYAASASTAT